MIKALTLSVISTVAGINPSFAQQLPSLTWANTFQTNESLAFRDSEIDLATGSVYHVGTFDGTVDFDPGSGVSSHTSSGYSCFILKLDADGNFIWVKIIQGTTGTMGASVAVDDQGSVHITGEYYNTTDFDPGSGVFNLTPNGDRDAFVLKLLNDGTFAWAKSVGGTEPDEGLSVAVDLNRNVVISGGFGDTVDFDPGSGVFNMTGIASSYNIFILKLDAAGNFVWAKTVGDGGQDQGRAVITDATGNVYLTGDFDGSGDFDPGPGTLTLTSLAYFDLFLLKLEPDGDFVYVKHMPGAGYFGSGYDIAIDVFGDLLITGAFESTMDFDPGPGTLTLTAAGGTLGTDAFICKLDAAGNLIWAKAFGGTSYEESYHIATDAQGNVTVNGYFYESGDFDPGPDTFTLTNAGAQDTFIIQLNTDGNFNWAFPIGGSDYDIPFSLSGTSAGALYLCGQFNDVVDVDPQSTTHNIGQAGQFMTFMIKLADPGGSDMTVYNAVSPNKDGKNDILFIANITPGNHLMIFDRYGSLVFEVKDYDNVTRVFGGLSSDGKELPSGTYYYKLEVSGLPTKTGFISLKK